MATDRPRFRVGIIGLGMMGQSLAETCLSEPCVELVAGCDVVESSRQAWGAAYGVADAGLYADAGAMFERVALDVVMVATHAPLHCEATLAAAARGIHVFCEKPLAPSLRDADEMVAACDAGGVKLAVNHIKRGSRGNEIARKLLADGAIGTPYLFRGEGKGGRWAASELMEMGTHIFDWLRILAGDPQWIFARLTQDDRPAVAADIVHSLDLPYRERDCGWVLGERAYCSLGLPGGMHAEVDFLSQPTGEDVGYGFDIVGTEGILALRRSVGTDIFLQRGRHRGPLGAPPWEPIEVDEFAGLEPPVTIRGMDGERLAMQRRLLGDFLQAIVEDREPWSSGRDGLRALELSMAVWESHLTDQPLMLPLIDRLHPLERRRYHSAH
jgi:predicted dehydrogenase